MGETAAMPGMIFSVLPGADDPVLSALNRPEPRWNIPSFRMSYQAMLLKTRADSRDWRFLEVK